MLRFACLVIFAGACGGGSHPPSTDPDGAPEMLQVQPPAYTVPIGRWSKYQVIADEVQ